MQGDIPQMYYENEDGSMTRYIDHIVGLQRVANQRGIEFNSINLADMYYHTHKTIHGSYVDKQEDYTTLMQERYDCIIENVNQELEDKIQDAKNYRA